MENETKVEEQTPVDDSQLKKEEPDTEVKKNDEGDVKNSTENGNENDAPKEEVVIPPPTIRRDFYQTDSDVVVNILAKNVNAQDVSVQFSSTTLEVKAKLPDGVDYELKVNLFGTIKPESCSHNVTRTKIEVRLRKDSAGYWTNLEAAEKKEVLPVYPSSSKSKKNWDKVEKEIETETKDEDSDINSLFSKIYNSGDEDMKKAMIKSMQESGGTVLSTNWSEVGKDKVKVSPPDGMEWKKWD